MEYICPYTKGIMVYWYDNSYPDGVYIIPSIEVFFYLVFHGNDPAHI